MGFYNNTELAVPPSSASVLAAPKKKSPFADKELPLELRAQGEYEPRYRVPLDALGAGEMPVLPISVYGAVAALRGDNGNDSSPAGEEDARMRRLRDASVSSCSASSAYASSSAIAPHKAVDSRA